MASNLPENLVGDMMSNAPRFTLPNFGAQTVLHPVLRYPPRKNLFRTVSPHRPPPP